MKRFLSLLLVAALVLSIPVAPVFAQTTTAQEENVTPVTDACPCGCGKTIEEIEWTPLPTKYFGSAPEGHHYLTQDFVQGDYGTTIIAGTNVVIDLRGYTWTSSSTASRLFTVQGNLWIMDTVGGGKLAPKLKAVYGGAILIDAYETASPSFTLVSGTLTTADGSGLPGGAGFVYAIEDSRFIMTGGVVENIHAKDYGGAIMASGTASIEILGGTIRNCSAGIRGGAIYSASTTPVVVKNTTFINNTVNVNTIATNGGGAIYSVPKLTVENCTFMNNSSTTASGGAIQAAGGLDLKDSTFIGNSAVNGGDLYLRNTGDSKIDNCKFYGGYSTLNGGSIVASAVNLTIKNTEMVGAIADKQGGHIYQSGGNVTIEKSTLNGGISNWEGSVYCGGGNLFALSGAVTTITDSTVRNGFAKVYGGNIAVAGTTLTLNNSTVTGGVAKFHGNNIGAQSASTVTINGGTIDGDIYIPAGKPITLKGQVKIGLRNNGLATGENANIDASGLTEGSEVYISGTGNLVAAGANMDYFKGAIRTSLSAGEGGVIVGTAGETGYCPHCLEEVIWEPLQDLGEATPSGHYYMAESVNGNPNHTYNGVDVVIDLNGKTLADTSSRAFTTRVVNGDCTLSILDSAGNGLVKSYGPGASSNGGVLFNNGIMNIYGGTFTNTAKGYAGNGGLIYNGGTLNIHGGFFNGSNYENTTSSTVGLGGTVCVPAGKTVTIHAGHFVGGKAHTGGNLYISTNAKANITGGTFVNGSASSSSGNIYFADSATGNVSVENAVIRGGSATTSAGNIRAGKAPTNTIKNCYIGEGEVTGTGAYGGNISVGGTNATFVDCVIYGGEASAKGGNVYTAGTGGTLKLDGCLITGGSATDNGGNIFFNHGNHQILGGEISYGTARVGGNIYAHAGNHASGGSVTIKKNADDEVPQIFGGSANYGGNLSVVGTLNLTDATIYSGSAAEAGADIQLAKLTDAKADPKLTVGSGVTGGRIGKIYMIAPVPAPVYGETVTYTVSAGLHQDVNIILEGAEGEPEIMAKDGVLKVSGAQLVNEAGKSAWFVDYEAAEAAADENSYVKLFADTDLSVTRDTFVDLNGHKVTVSGTGKLLGMDTTGDNYDLPKGKVAFEGTSPIADKSMVYAPNGNKYVALVEGNEVTFHRLGADLTTVTINIDRNGVYFKGKFGADEKLKGMIDTYGIAVSLQDMPTSDLTGTHKSAFKGADMENGETASGVIITNILKDGLEAGVNAARGQMKIYASAYVALNDGTTVLMGDQADTAEDDVAWSLYDAFVRLDALIDEDPTHFRRYTNDMRQYYAKWKDLGIKDWIGENTNYVEPEDDGVIDVLMIGSSSCYYYVEEMASLAAAAGIKLRVCNVYYSGCPINKYYQDWLNNYADYQFFDTTAEVQPDGTIKATRKVLGGGKTLEWCLAQGDWDIISMQSTGRLVMRDYLKGVDHLEASDIKEATEFMFPYIQSQFPDAHLYIREQSAYQVGKVLSISGISNPYKFENLEDQQEYAFAQKDASVRMVEKFNAAPYNLNMRVMPASQAMMLVREGFGQWEGYDQLCARVGFRPSSPDISFDENDKHEGDHGHVGDIGGGQYVEAALWLQVIMQDYYDADFDVRDITWVPTYYYSGEVVENRFDAEFMREAAYKAAKEGWNYTPPAN